MTDEQILIAQQCAEIQVKKKTNQNDEALMQDCVSFLFEKYSSFDESKGKFSSFAHQVMSNYIIDRKRKEMREQKTSELHDNIPVEEKEDNKDVIVQVINGVRKLPYQEQRIIRFIYWQGKSFSQIAKENNLAKSTIAFFRDKAIDKLRATVKV
jgi:RNA polymerase sigma factor (sigma-70 family)